MPSQRRTRTIQDCRGYIVAHEYTSADSVSVYCLGSGHWTFGFHLCVCIDLFYRLYDLCKLRTSGSSVFGL